MSTATDTLPVVRMCDNPACGGAWACPDVRMDQRTMAIGEWIPADRVVAEDDILRIMRQETVLDGASDSKGTLHMIPAGAQFTVHKGTRGLSAAGITILEQQGHVIGQGEYYVAVYSGPEGDLDDILADSPEWTREQALERLDHLNSGS